jgi:UDP-N-acetyl-2-amino-2-deoxyglucuronate dehydrogenase
MNVGIIGGGNISETHARAVAAVEGLTVAAIYGSNADRVGRLAAEFGATAYADLDEFLRHPLDFVIIGSPSGCHADEGIACARRGVHVLAEKPLDVTTERVDALIAATDAARVKLGVCFQDRLHPAIREARTMIADGVIGTPILISGRVRWFRPPEYYSGSRWRGSWTYDGGGALMNQAIHTVDLMQWMFGPVTRVYGAAGTLLHSIQVEDTATAVLEFRSGALGTIEAATSVYPGYPRQLEVTGSMGTLAIEHDRLVRIDLKSGGRIVEAPGASDANASASSPRVSDARGHQRIVEDFVQAIRSDGTPACDGREGRRSVALIQAIYASAASHQPVAPDM